ncbi:signal peptide containing protein [Theileria equi strain WA]|uniref:Signal peptide containing protein n=1 Tax=Theileria equi strain WA TaxID=1537102 RepID=L1LDB7_THEEQ|nr:signal peptide containing protein [Theileria equi strain WA]EKX73336.1 signal peptide containing protein [Theileria equi strain WA]|eukprot:XP_004832788.1 signal peptide containing protein [Theileria equi strain WA]
MVALSVTLIIISFTGIVPAVGLPSARDELARLKNELNEQSLLAMESVKKRQMLDEMAKVAIEWIKGVTSKLWIPLDKKIKEVEKFRDEISQSIKKAYPIMRPIFHEANTMIHQVNDVLAGTDEDAMLAKAREVEEVLKRNKVGLKKLDDEFKGLIKRLEEFKRAAVSLGFQIPDDFFEKFNAAFQNGGNSQSFYYSKEYDPNRKLSEDEFIKSFFRTNQIPKLSKEQFVQIINLLKNSSNKLINDINGIITRGKKLIEDAKEDLQKADELVKRMKKMGYKNPDITGRYEMIFREVKNMGECYRDMVTKEESLRSNLEKCISILDGAMEKAQDLQDGTVLDKWDNILGLEIMKETLTGIIDAKIGVANMKLCYIDVDFQRCIVTERLRLMTITLDSLDKVTNEPLENPPYHNLEDSRTRDEMSNYGFSLVMALAVCTMWI